MKSAFHSADDLAEAIVAAVGKTIVLGLPVGIGKSLRIANALFRRAAADPAISLKIFTGLTLESPHGRTELESRFLEPLVERLYAGWPRAEYLQALKAGRLPPNVEVREFYLRPGAFLNSPSVQQSYASLNYSQVARELRGLGVNVIAQLVARRVDNPAMLSLSSNPEITLDLIARHGDEAERPILLVGEIHPSMPFMTGEAELPADRFDLLLDDGQSHYPLFVLPNRRVSPADYAAGMHVASLIPDGGTIQVGIGSLSDAVAHCLTVRDRFPEVFDEVLHKLPGGTSAARRADLPVERGAFERGLFASSELLSDALFSLFEAGVVRRTAGAGDETCVHAGFFIGSGRLYRALRELPESARQQIRMTRISEVNTLFGDEHRKREQRRSARFVNETMMVTLLGGAVSDGLEDGRVVSGVGGQFDFVSMAHALDDARSVLVFRATREHAGRSRSNVRWNYGHLTVPRHYRDVFVSEYGVAATRGLPDAEVVGAILGITDSRFQDGLLEDARRAGKIGRDYSIPADARGNRPESIERVFAEPAIAERFPPYPLGSELTPVERELGAALTWLAGASARPAGKAKLVLRSIFGGQPGADAAALEHMRLDRPANARERIYRKLLGLALQRTKESA